MKHLSFLFTFMLLPLLAEAQTVQIDGLNYILDTSNHEAAVTRGAIPYSGEIVIPSTIEYKRNTYTVTKIGDFAFSQSFEMTSVTIPSSVTSIESCAFEYCGGLTSIAIPENVTKIGVYAFSGCTKLTSVRIPGTVENLENYVFAGCNGLHDVAISEGVTSIGAYTFNYCTGLSVISIPSTVKSIGEHAFANCTELSAVHISSLLAWCKLEMQSSPIYYGAKLYVNGEELKDLVIPSGVRTIGDRLFRGCTSLTTVTIPEGVTAIGNYVFTDCINITSVSLANSVKSIGDYVFNNCTSLTHIEIPKAITKIGEGTFDGCSSMTSVTIPEQLTEIGKDAFNGCNRLEEVYIFDLAAWCNIDFQSNPLNYARHLYLNYEDQRNIVIPDGVTRISDMAFQGYIYLYSVTMPDGVASIGSKAFQGCTFLSTVTIPSDVETICEEAFQGCTRLRNFYCYAEKIPTTAANAFSGASTHNATLYVPNGVISDYKATAPWSSFMEVRKLYPDLPDLKCDTPTISYKRGQIVFDCETPKAIVTSEVKAANTEKKVGNSFKLEWAYEISFYASAEGYLDSSVAKATIGLKDGKPVMEGFSKIELEPDGGRGDVNTDGIVDVADIATIIDIMAKAARLQEQ